MFGELVDSARGLDFFGPGLDEDEVAAVPSVEIVKLVGRLPVHRLVDNFLADGSALDQSIDDLDHSSTGAGNRSRFLGLQSAEQNHKPKQGVAPIGLAESDADD